MKLAVAALLVPMVAGAQTAGDAITIPPIKTTIDLGGQQIEITAWGTLSPASDKDFSLALTVDLADLQKHLPEVLAAELNRSEQCGERIALENALLNPKPPSSIMSATVNYERYACAKAFGKQVVKKLVGGKAMLEIKLTPEVADNNISVNAEVRKLEADGSLGQLLRSDAGDSLRQDIGDRIESAIQKATDLTRTLPRIASNAVTIQKVDFAGGPASQLWLSIAAQVHLTAEELKRAVGQ